MSTAGGPRQLTLTVGHAGLISGLRLSLVIPPAPTTWQGVDAAVRSVAPRVRLLVARVTGGSCQPVDSIDPGTAAPLPFAGRLYVLDALATAIASGKVSWNQPLTVTAQLKSPGSGDLQNEPDGIRISVLDAAAKMISSNDNTAADMLISLLGRPAVEAALAAAGMADPSRNIPFLTARELITLKLDQWPALAQRYIAASQAGRLALLSSVVDRAPLPSAAALAAWTTPRDISSIERFASASDICRVYTSLAALARRPGLSPVASVLGTGGLGLDPAQWQTTWFSGGSEPGVLTYTFMATTRTGHSYVVAVLAENPSAPINEAVATPAVLSAVRGAFTWPHAADCRRAASRRQFRSESVPGRRLDEARGPDLAVARGLAAGQCGRRSTWAAAPGKCCAPAGRAFGLRHGPTGPARRAGRSVDAKVGPRRGWPALQGGRLMNTVALVVKMVAKDGTQQEVADFLAGAVDLANAEAGTTVWFALRTDDRTFWIVDAFPGEAERQAHLDGPIASALMANAGRLLAEPPSISPAQVLASKVTA